MVKDFNLFAVPPSSFTSRNSLQDDIFWWSYHIIPWARISPQFPHHVGYVSDSYLSWPRYPLVSNKTWSFRCPPQSFQDLVRRWKTLTPISLTPRISTFGLSPRATLWAELRSCFMRHAHLARINFSIVPYKIWYYSSRSQIIQIIDQMSFTCDTLGYSQ